jgi:hypothetical protein
MRAHSVWAGLLFVLATAAGAQPAPGPSDPREVEAFFDGSVPALLGAQSVYWRIFGAAIG